MGGAPAQGAPKHPYENIPPDKGGPHERLDPGFLYVI